VPDAVLDPVVALGGPPPRVPAPEWLVGPPAGADELATYHALRRQAFVEEQGLFADDRDEHDGAASTVVLVARAADGGAVLGGVRLHPGDPDRDLAWWQGSRLVCAPGLGARRGAVGAALVRAACAVAEARGALRFDATVQPRFERFFAKLGWQRLRDVTVAGAPHVLMRWPVGRIAALAAATKGPLAPVLAGVTGGVPAGWRGDDGVPIPGSDLVAATDAIVPRMVARDPEWAGCS
jgi:putative N-acetyltransferase (TIGR04045 family)